MLEGLSVSKDCECYREWIVDSLPELVDLCLAENVPINYQRQAAKGMLSLMKAFTDGQRQPLSPLEAKLSQCLGLYIAAEPRSIPIKSL